MFAVIYIFLGLINLLLALGGSGNVSLFNFWVSGWCFAFAVCRILDDYPG